MSLNKATRVKERKGEMPCFLSDRHLADLSLNHFQGLICHLCNDQARAQLLCSFLCTAIAEHCCEWQNNITLAVTVMHDALLSHATNTWRLHCDTVCFGISLNSKTELKTLGCQYGANCCAFLARHCHTHFVSQPSSRQVQNGDEMFTLLGGKI